MTLETFTPDEVAKILKLSAETVRDYAQTGRIPGAFKLGGFWRFRRAEFEDWLLSQKSAPRDPHRVQPRSARSKARRHL